MRHNLKMICISLSLFFALSGCMEMLTADREQVSKIDKFIVDPNGVAIANNGSFTINMDVTMGYDMDIYVQNVTTNRVVSVYHTTKEDGYDKAIKVNVSIPSMGIRGTLTSNVKGWEKFDADLNVDYIIYAKVCDFANLPGNGACATSAGYRLAFRNL